MMVYKHYYYCNNEHKTHAERYQWCEQQFGSKGPRWTYEIWSYTGMTVYFNNEQDKTFFIMRWSE